MYNEKRHYNFWTKFCDSSHSARYFSISHLVKKGYELNISPNLCLIRILQWFHQRNQMALELFRNSSKILSEFHRKFFQNSFGILSEFFQNSLRMYGWGGSDVDFKTQDFTALIKWVLGVFTWTWTDLLNPKRATVVYF